MIEEATLKWKDYLVGYFVSGSMNLNVVEQVANDFWDKLGLGRVLVDASGFFFCQVLDAAARQRILEGGPWLFYCGTLIVQQWTSELVLCKKTHDTNPL